jgi:hypothetical protein
VGEGRRECQASERRTTATVALKISATGGHFCLTLPSLATPGNITQATTRTYPRDTTKRLP